MSRSKLYNAMVIALTMALMSISSLSSASAAPGVRTYGPFASTSEDSGTCGNSWASDTFNRFFKVFTTQNADNTYTVIEDFRQGSFVTVLGQSPGACQPEGNPNGTVGEGVTGKFSGTFTVIVSNGTYNPAAAAVGTSTLDFVHAVFGPSATFDVPSFSFEYSTKHNGSWINSDKGNSGDITGD